MSKNKNHNLLVGTAIAAGIIGTLTGLFGYKRNKRKDRFLTYRDGVNKKLVLGGVAGGLIGATTALLLAPKAGTELLRDIAAIVSRPRKYKFSLPDRLFYRENGQKRRTARAKPPLRKRGAKRPQAGHHKIAAPKRTAPRKKNKIHTVHPHHHEKSATSHEMM